MKRSLIVTALFTACASSQGGVAIFPFFGVDGAEYTTVNYVQQVYERFPGTDPLLFLLVTRSFEEPEFKTQVAELKDVDAERYQLMYVTGSATGTDKHGYWLESEHADALLESGDRFRLLVIAAGGEVCFSSSKALKAREIVASNKVLQPTFLRCAQKRG